MNEVYKKVVSNIAKETLKQLMDNCVKITITEEDGNYKVDYTLPTLPKIEREAVKILNSLTNFPVAKINATSSEAIYPTVIIECHGQKYLMPVNVYSWAGSSFKTGESMSLQVWINTAVAINLGEKDESV